MKDNSQIIQEVQAIYSWLDAGIAAIGRGCRACGNCCDFDAYGHRLYVTTPEFIYFKHFVGPDLKPMPTGVCPYRVDNKCTVYPYRFSGCRIFDCRTDALAQTKLCEQSIHRFKELCNTLNIPYRYVYLKDALNRLAENK
jgi:Fe-S-cluster containining protein